MAWRVIEQGDQRWQVSPAAEQHPDSRGWSLVFCFRSPGRRAIWASAPVASPSKAAVYLHAERMSDDTLLGLLTQAITEERQA
jgi:hypothetical protein